MNTTNRSERNITQKFDLGNFNKTFEERRASIELGSENVYDYEESNDDIMNEIPIHKKPVETIIVSVRDLFNNSLDMLVDKQNPIPYIFSNEDRKFCFSIFLIIMGTLLLLFSNLMISSKKS